MDARDQLVEEAAFEPEARTLVRKVNRRIGQYPSTGEFWVRLRPPSIDELTSDARHPSLVKFYRVGYLAQVAEVLKDFVEVVCCGETLLLELSEFLDTWVRVNVWPDRPSRIPESRTEARP